VSEAIWKKAASPIAAAHLYLAYTVLEKAPLSLYQFLCSMQRFITRSDEYLLVKLAFHGADTDTYTDTDTDSPNTATVLCPTHAISSRGSSRRSRQGCPCRCRYRRRGIPAYVNIRCDVGGGGGGAGWVGSCSFWCTTTSSSPHTPCPCGSPWSSLCSATSHACTDSSSQSRRQQSRLVADTS